MIIAAGITFSVVVLSIILVLLVRRQLREKYAILWLVVGLVVLVLSLFPGLLVGMTRALGVALPSNLIFALAITLLVGVTLHLSWELSRAEEEIRRVAEEVAILRTDLDSLREFPGSADHVADVKRSLSPDLDPDPPANTQ